MISGPGSEGGREGGKGLTLELCSVRIWRVCEGLTTASERVNSEIIASETGVKKLKQRSYEKGVITETKSL